MDLMDTNGVTVQLASLFVRFTIVRHGEDVVETSDFSRSSSAQSLISTTSASGQGQAEAKGAGRSSPGLEILPESTEEQ